MIMKGLIYEPFGVPKLAFGDMVIAIGITVSGGLPSFRKFFFIFFVEKQFEKTTGRSARKLLTLNINN